MAATVRERMIAAIIAALEGLPSVGVGGVIFPDVEADDFPIASRSAAKKYTIEMRVHNDVPDQDPKVAAGQIERWETPIELTIHLPSPRPNADAGGGVQAVYVTASRIAARIYELYAGAAASPGRWPDADGDTAMATYSLGGGGVYFDRHYRTNVTEHAFSVQWRHRAGFPEEAV